MRRYLAVFYFIGSVLFTVIPAWGAANERTMRSLEVIREDKSCYGVNRAYEKMHNSGRFTSNIYEVTPNDGRRLYLQMHEVDQYYFVKIGDELWQRYKRTPIRTTIDNRTDRPIFTACRFQGVEDINGEPALRYGADWQRNGWQASIDIWISKASGKFIQTLSQYRQGHGEFSFPKALQIMDYDRSHAAEPLK